MFKIDLKKVDIEMMVTSVCIFAGTFAMKTRRRTLALKVVGATNILVSSSNNSNFLFRQAAAVKGFTPDTIYGLSMFQFDFPHPCALSSGSSQMLPDHLP